MTKSNQCNDGICEHQVKSELFAMAMFSVFAFIVRNVESLLESKDDIGFGAISRLGSRVRHGWHVTKSGYSASPRFFLLVLGSDS